jgi:glycosyltransferase involved in cell wall biosynthesis
MIMPLHDATANNAVLEGMACGVPMVISDVGAVRDYVSPAGAEIIPPYDARRMAESTIDLLADPQRRAKMGQEAQKRAFQFAWPTVIEQLKSIYAALD